MRFTHEPLAVILDHLQEVLSRAGAVTIEVPNPDLTPGLYPGECSELGRHRPLRVWTDLADRLELRLRMPRIQGSNVVLTFESLNAARHLLSRTAPKVGKYAPGNGFERVTKLEDPDFVLDMRDALARIRPRKGCRVLSLGVNRGDELELAGGP